MRQGIVLVLALLAGLLAGAAGAQTDAEAKRWDGVATTAEERIADPATSTDQLNELRERLVGQRNAISAAEQAAKPAVDELNQRLQAIGPAPAEGQDEAPEVAELRRTLQEEIATAQAPVLTAQEAYKRTETLIASIDRTVRARFSAELMQRAPSPLRPAGWGNAAGELAARARDYRDQVNSEIEGGGSRNQLLRRVPVKLLLLVAGLAVAFWVRGLLIEWIESRLAVARDRRSVAWLVALRNLTRLVVPMVGAGLLFSAFDPEGLLQPGDERRFFSLPPFVLVLIGAGWLGGSLLAPKYRAFRLVPLEDDEAWRAMRVILLLALAVALAMLFASLAVRWDLSTSTQAVLQFPLVLVGAFGLWRSAALMEVARQRILAHGGAARLDSATASIGMRFLQGLIRALRFIAVVAPLLAAAGYLPLAGFMVFRTALTLGLLGAIHVVFDLLNKAAEAFLANPAGPAQDADAGLMPVFVAALVGIAGLPLLAMIWGARWSDIADFWTTMREGVMLGGIRLSATALIVLIMVFALGFGLTRLLQTVLRGTVLPRTRFDAGGRNAVLAGVGYVGFGLAGLAAVSAAGLNLSSLAIVAGALSVGIGFGLQNIVSNFVSGIILLVERPVKEGDWIEVGGFSGYVRGIKVRSTEIETFDRATVILPNSDLIAGTVLNRTHKGMSGRLQVPVSVAYDSDPKKVEAILLAIADEQPLILQEPAPRVLFMQLGPDSMDFELRCWLRDVNFSLSVRSDVNFEITGRFREAGIRMQFYGRDLAPPPPEQGPPPPDPEAVTLQRGKQERGAL
jgi:potassium-dependent mechanosensitive channel